MKQIERNSFTFSILGYSPASVKKEFGLKKRLEKYLKEYFKNKIFKIIIKKKYIVKCYHRLITKI
jgi:hypothetical protein